MDKLIGDKLSFAVEYSAVKTSGSLHYGECGVWIAGVLLQDIRTEIFVESVLMELKGLLKVPSSSDPPPPAPRDSHKFLDEMEGRGELASPDSHFFLAVEGFDGFLKLFFKSDDQTTFWLALHPDVQVPTSKELQGGVVISAGVPNQEIESVVKRLEQELKTL